MNVHKGLGWIALAIVAGSIGLTGAVCVSHASEIATYREPDTTVVDSPVTDSEIDVFCAPFERIDRVTWRTESGANVPASTWSDEVQDFVLTVVHVPPSDIGDAHAADLFWTLESSCREESNG